MKKHQVLAGAAVGLGCLAVIFPGSARANIFDDALSGDLCITQV